MVAARTRFTLISMEKQADVIKEELAQYIANHLYRITTNLTRVPNLIELANAQRPQITREDILRAAVVFLHATLEDFLRYIGMNYLLTAGEAALDKIGLVGSSDVLRAEKFFLGKLAKHRGKTVDQVIKESVAGYLDRTSFGDPVDISRLLEACGIRLEHVREFYLEIGDLMTRRHQIVHRADLVDTSVEGPRNTASIDAATVTSWNDAVKSFISVVIAEKIGEEFVPRIVKSKREASRKALTPTTGAAQPHPAIRASF